MARSWFRRCAGALQSSNLEHLGVHPSNRDGLGVNAGDVRDLLDSIATVGILPERVNRVAVEIKGDRVRQFNPRWWPSPAAPSTSWSRRCSRPPPCAERKRISCCGTAFMRDLAQEFPEFLRLLQQYGNTSLERGNPSAVKDPLPLRAGQGSRLPACQKTALATKPKRAAAVRVFG